MKGQCIRRGKMIRNIKRKFNNLSHGAKYFGQIVIEFK